MIKMNLKAFTLVELIVVITILAILATIAFISFQGYIENARDSVRMTDVKLIEKSLELHVISNGTYPDPSNPVNITFSGSTAWTQGTFGPSTLKIVAKMSEVPVDPLTKNQYSYSVTTKKNEFQVGAILENQVSSSVVQTYAENDTAYAYIRGNYNGKIIGLRVATTDYILGVPSIIASDILSVNILDIISQKKLSYSGFNNLPSSYSGTIYNPLGGFDFGPSDIVVWSGSVNDLKTKPGERELFADKLKLIYETSIIKDSDRIKPIVNMTSENKDYFASIILNEGIGTHIKVSEPIVGSTAPTPPTPTSTKFITTWDVGLDTGISGFGKLKLPLTSGGTYNFTVDWGDGNTNVITSYNQAEATHTYASNGIYDVTIDGVIEGFTFNEVSYWTDNQHDGDKLIDIKNWGNVKIADGGAQFSHVENLVNWSALDVPDTSHITNMSKMFYNATKFNQALSFDTSNVTDMSSMFVNATNFNETLDLNTRNVTSMNYMFGYATKFNKSLSFNTGKVTDMGNMFEGASAFNKPLSFDTRNVIYMLSMFAYATNFDEILTFNTINVTDMGNMFQGATSFNKPLSFNTENVTIMYAMFESASSFDKPLSFDTTKVITMHSMFANATSFDSLLTFDTSNVTSMRYMFKGATSFNKPLSFNTVKVTNMGSMFNLATKFNQNLSGWCVSLIGSEPTLFSTSSALTSVNKPVWGTCP